MKTSGRALTALAFFFCASFVAGQTNRPASGADLFVPGRVHRIQITIPSDGVSQLRTNARRYVEAELLEGTNRYAPVWLHLKGAAGSFRTLNEKPSLTVSFDKFQPGLRFHGLSKIHLNNSVEDPSYLNEQIGAAVFLAAGVPATRASHAVVHLNGRRLGLYVLKEGFTKEFLGQHFEHPAGDLYEPIQGHDIDEDLEKQLGANPEDRSDLEVLTAAARIPDLSRRWQRLRGVLDVERFLSYMAGEIALGHRDGYCLARNNFRIYHDVDSGRLMFFPHGMDQLFGNARAPIQPSMNGVLAKAVLEIPEGRRAFRSRLESLLTNAFTLGRVDSVIASSWPGLRGVLPAEESAALEKEITLLRQRVGARWSNVTAQLLQNPMEPLRFVEGRAAVTGWRAVDVPEGGDCAQTNLAGRAVLGIRAGPITSASWRAKVLLPPGTYRFEGEARTEAVAPLKFGKNHGAGLRVVPAGSNRPTGLLGNQPWTRQQVSFATTARETEVELICELRASRGEAWFDLDSLRVVRE